MTNDTEKRKIRTVCRECFKFCGMIANIERGKIVSLEKDPFSMQPGDSLCKMANSALERVYHPDRLHFPMKRKGERGEGKYWGNH